MTRYWKLACIAMVSSIVVPGRTTSTESSAEYLHNVMNQLQEHNRPSPMSLDRTTGPGVERAPLSGQEDNLDRGKQQEVYQRYYNTQSRNPVPDIGETDQHFPASSPAYYRVPVPQTFARHPQLEGPDPLGLTRAELASMYKNALEKGSAIGLSSLTNAIASAGAPQVTGNHLQLSPGNPGYYFYYYPLKSFMKELRNNHGYRTIRIPGDTEKEGSADVDDDASEKRMGNPLFMAISGFISMAMLFMMGVLFLPKFGGFKSRGVHDEFLQLAKIAGEAIDGRNCSERLECELGKATRTLNLPLGPFRYLETVLPTNLGKQVAKVRRSAKKSQDCRLIGCKKSELIDCKPQN